MGSKAAIPIWLPAGRERARLRGAGASQVRPGPRGAPGLQHSLVPGQPHPVAPGGAETAARPRRQTWPLPSRGSAPASHPRAWPWGPGSRPPPGTARVQAPRPSAHPSGGLAERRGEGSGRSPEAQPPLRTPASLGRPLSPRPCS